MKIQSVRIKDFRTLKDVTITACNNVESAAGISLAKNQLAYRTAALEAAGTVPEMLTQILATAEGK